MKRLDIPINRRIIKSFPDILFEGFNDIKDVDIFDFYHQISTKDNLTKEELIYIYNIYNRRLLCDMYSKYDYDLNGWKDKIYYMTFLNTGYWFYDVRDPEQIEVIKKINEKLDLRKDMATIFDCDIDEVATTQKELDANPDKYVVLLDSLRINYKDYCNYPRLKCIIGILLANSLEESEGLKSLEFIGSNAWLDNLTNLSGLKNLKAVSGSLSLKSAKSVASLKSLESVGWDICIPNASLAVGLESLKYIGGNADFNNLIEATNLCNLSLIIKKAHLPSLYTVGSFPHLEYVGEGIFINDNRVKTKIRTKNNER